MMDRRAPVHSSRLVRAADARLRAMECREYDSATPEYILDYSHTDGCSFSREEVEEADAFLFRLGLSAGRHDWTVCC